MALNRVLHSLFKKLLGPELGQSFVHASKSRNLRLPILLFTIIFIFSACVPQSGGSGGRKSKSSSNATTTTTKSPAPAPSFGSDSMYWFTGSKVTGVVTVNQNTESVIYLRGSNVHTFLDARDSGGTLTNFNNIYCMVFGYNKTGAKKQVRARAIPITYNDFVNKTTERLFRVDLPSQSENLASCTGTIGGISASGQVAYIPGDFCSTCFEIVASNSFGLYVSSGNSIADGSLVPISFLNTQGLGLRIDTLSGSTSSESVCSNSSCSAKGFDCCLNGQCVKDGTEKPNVSTDPSYSQAQQDISVNPLNFINWPNIFYVCPNIPRVQATPTAFPDAQATGNAAFEILKREYLCLEEGKKTSPNYANGTCSKTSFTTKSTCETGGGTWTFFCYPSGLSSNYVSIRNDVWLRCGCEAVPFPTTPEENTKCPDFGLQATLDLANNITSVTCKIPVPNIFPTPFQELQINISSRTVPHRFFRSDNGQAVDDLSTLKNISPVPQAEGTPFSYLDEASKTGPIGHTNYNMNSILGQMLVDLSRARPAKVINVEFDQTYIISATRGNYSPCPQCAKDSWFEAFTPFPNSTQGRGLEAIGHNTARDLYQTNITLGNYEDTIFGRACFVPPTMIPWSHKKGTTAAAQRSNRLKTQAAFFVNGYQRDWYGFNRGAIIGSFDGVSWFAVGNGRRIQAKSNKLYLAINAPYGDLADATDTIVNIVLDNGFNVAADFDFDPNLAQFDATQNTGASCQRYHQCDTDSDCITQLGWEYMCINTSSVKTYVPKFDLDGVEQIDETSGGMSKILGGQAIPPGSKKRCVYRGMGSPCKLDYTAGTTLTGSTVGARKLLACAPNFYCEKLDSSTVFNDQIIREPNAMSNILYGRDADVLGRPKSYTSGGKSFPTEVRNNIAYNLALYTSTPTTPLSLSQWGLCMPGKIIGSSQNTYLSQHQSKDNSRRTDFISQIGNCNADATTAVNRIQTCPAIDERPFIGTTKNTNYGNLIIDGFGGGSGIVEDSTSGNAYFTAKNPNDSDKTFRSTQNMCGKEARTSTGANAFASIEYPNLPVNVLLPGHAAFACLRRAGAVCHTDMDCGPNNFHASEARNLVASYFGNSPEHQYWKENLICGQRDPIPFLNATGFNDYKMNKNRCCREVGKDLSLYTSSYDANKQGLESLTSIGITSATHFNTTTLPSDGPSATARYSRYSNLPLGKSNTYGASFTAPHMINLTGTNLSSSGLQYQWKAINESAKLTCCGGGAIRKFADGTHDWTKRDRLKINPENFRCLNYLHEVAYDEDAARAQTHYDTWLQDSIRYCEAPENGTGRGGKGCMQTAIPGSDGGFIIDVPKFGDDAEGTFVYGTGSGATAQIYDLADADDVVDKLHFLEVFPSVNVLANSSSSYQARTDLPERVSRYAPFIPTPYYFFDMLPPSSGPTNDAPAVPWRNSIDDYPNFIAFLVPSYLGNVTTTVGSIGNIQNIHLTWYGAGSGSGLSSSMAKVVVRNLRDRQITCADYAAAKALASSTGPQDNNWCIFYDPVIGRQVFLIKVDTDGDVVNYVNRGDVNGDGNRDASDTGTGAGPDTVANTANGNQHQVGVTIQFTPLGSSDAQGMNNSIDGLIPGNSNYYLSKLGRFELLGIPQIFYEPLRCSANQSKIVPGMFSDGSSTSTTMSQFNSLSSRFATSMPLAQIYGSTNPASDPIANSSNAVVFKNNVAMPDVFSEKDFLCCKTLGSRVSDKGQCCSGYAIQGSGSGSGATAVPPGLDCALPLGTNLMVYFNRYVSTEGTDTEGPGGGLTDEDFVAMTGEIAWNEDSYNKVKALGEAFCETKAIMPGGAFGHFFGEPNSFIFQPADDSAGSGSSSVLANRIFSIVDGPRDGDSVSSPFFRGYPIFQAGYRWNHHLYCGPPQNGGGGGGGGGP